MFSLRSIFSCIMVFFALAMGATATVNLAACYEDIIKGVHGTLVGINLHGYPVANISEAKGVNYTTCLLACGSGIEPFNWSIFAQQFTAWLMPWLALISQLPFGAEGRSDNVFSFLLALGSPALAAYSLALTALNHYWLKKRLAEFKYPNIKRFISIFSALQHIPTHITTKGPSLSSLVVLPENDIWWSEMAERTDQTHNWNVPAAFNIGWVLVAFLFIIIYSFYDFGSFISSHGHAVASAWMWLLPLVVGWLRIGSQTESNQLRRALQYINTLGYAIDYARQENSSAHRDEQRAAPIFNYSRVFVWSQSAEYVARLYSAASRKANAQVTVDGRKWVPSNSADGSIHPDNRIGCEDEVIRYCQASRSLKGWEGHSNPPFDAQSMRWAPGVLMRVTIATILGLFLQWCTSGAAFMLTTLTPATGLGCRSTAYLVYSIAGSLSLIFHILSSLIAHASRPPYGQNRLHRSVFIGGLATAFRWLGKTLAILNAFIIIAASTFQFTNMYNSCFCMSSVIGRGKSNAYILFPTGSDLIGMGTRSVWVGGVALALGAAVLYGSFVYFVSSNNA